MISIVIPVHNESENIASLVNSIRKILSDSSFNYEIIVIDDASTDDTLLKLKSMRQSIDQLRVLKHEKNCGQSRGIHSGVMASHGDIIVTMDGDGQNDPADIPSMVNHLINSDDSMLKMVAGHRVKRNDSPWRKVSSVVANRVRAFVLKDDTPDTGCGLKVFYKDVFMAMPYFDHMHRFLPALVRRQGYLVTSVRVNHLERKGGNSHYGTLDRLAAGVVDLLGVFWLTRRAKITTVVESDKENKRI